LLEKGDREGFNKINGDWGEEIGQRSQKKKI